MKPTTDDTVAPRRIKHRSLMFAALVLTGAMSLAACHQEGPAEKAGKSLDNAGQKLQDAIDPPGPAQKAGRAIDNATQ